MKFDPESAAAQLIDARRAFRQWVPSGVAPASNAGAYAIQNSVAKEFGPVTGWKVGSKSPQDTPNCAPLFADLVRPSPIDWPAASLHMIGVEAEIAFRLSHDILPRSFAIAKEEIWSAIGSVHAAIEVVDTRLGDWKSADPLWVLADNQSNGGLVYEPIGMPVEASSYADAAVRLVINGETVADKRGGNSAGDPRWLVEWVVDHCARERDGLAAGTIITTGSFTGMIFVELGANVRAEFQGIGEVEIRFPSDPPSGSNPLSAAFASADHHRRNSHSR